MKLSVKELCLISLIGALEFVVFTSFSPILYLECITFTIVVVAMHFKARIAFLSSLTFTIVNLMVMGITPWSLLYVLLYPSYSILLSCLKNTLKEHLFLVSIACGVLSFLTGQILELPYLLVSTTITLAYLIVGLKTSIIQGLMSGVFTSICYQPIRKILSRLEK